MLMEALETVFDFTFKKFHVDFLHSAQDVSDTVDSINAMDDAFDKINSIDLSQPSAFQKLNILKSTIGKNLAPVLKNIPNKAISVWGGNAESILTDLYKKKIQIKLLELEMAKTMNV